MEDKNTVIMCSEPAPNLTTEMVTKKIAEIETELDLATLFAIVSNKAWWIEDNEYDYDKDTFEYEEAVKETDLWFGLADILKNRIFDTLRDEGIEIPEKKQIIVLEPFMERNGYKDGYGWWIKG